MPFDPRLRGVLEGEGKKRTMQRKPKGKRMTKKRNHLEVSGM